MDSDLTAVDMDLVDAGLVASLITRLNCVSLWAAVVLRWQRVVRRRPRDQSASAGVDGSRTADGTAVQDGTARGVTHLLDMPRECVERGISVRTQRVLEMCRVAGAVSHVSQADTEQDQSLHVMIVNFVAFHCSYYFACICIVLYSFLRVRVMTEA